MKILAVDYGDARTGLAVCDKMELLASPMCVVHEKDREKTVQKIADIIKENKIDEIVIGYPKNMNNSLGERARLCEEFAKMLEEKTRTPCKLWDERGTTVQAHNYLNTTDTKGKKRKNIVDAVAATIILESYLKYRKNNNLK